MPNFTFSQINNTEFLNANKKLTQFVLRNWTTQQGLHSNTLLKIKQDTKGYLWISSYDGLIRFDGLKFEVFSKVNRPELNSIRFGNVELDAEKGLLMASARDGILNFSNGKFHSVYPSLKKLNVISFAKDKEMNRLWVGTEGEGLWFLEDSIVREVQYPPVQNTIIYDVFLDRKGALWVGADGKGLSRFYQGKWQTFGKEQGLRSNKIYKIVEGQKGNVWVCSTEGLFLFRDGKFQEIDRFSDIWIYKVEEDKKGNLLVASQNGLCRMFANNGEVECLGIAEGLPDQEVVDFTFDSEGNLWFTTYRGGLMQLLVGKFNNFTQQEGIATKSVSMVYEAYPNELWVGTMNGTINIIKDGKVSDLKLNQPLRDGRIYDILKDRDGTIWIATYSGILKKYANGKEVWIESGSQIPTNAIRILKEDNQGNIWIGTRTHGAVKIQENGTAVNYNVSTGILGDLIMAIEEDGQGNIWLATAGQGVNKITQEGQIQAFIEEKDDIASNLVFNIHPMKDGSVWLATKNGISWLKNDKSYNFGYQQIPIVSVYDILEDNLGFFWLASSKGLVKVKRTDLERWATSKNPEPIKWEIYDMRDGMKDSECVAATFSTKSEDGRLWFPTIGGVTTVNPKYLKAEAKAPKIHLQAMQKDSLFLDLYGEEIKLLPENQRITFEFTGIYLTAPSKIRYRYQLEGFDKSIKMTGKQSVDYTNLPHGTYTFKVWAGALNGTWSEKPAEISFTIKTPLWAKAWFQILMVLLLLAVITTFHKIRMYQIRRQKKYLELEVQRRTAQLRVAKEQAETQSKQISEQNTILNQQKEEITATNEEVERQNRFLEQYASEIKGQEIQLQKTNKVIAHQNEELSVLNEDLDAKVKQRTEELDKAYKDLLSVHKQLDHFTYRSSHDLKGPIARLLGLCYLGKMELNDPLGLSYIEKLEGATQQMGTLINKLLRTHEIRTHQPNPKNISLNKTIKEIWQRFYGYSDQITFQLDTQKEFFYTADSFWLNTLIENIIENAIEYQDSSKQSFFSIKIEASKEAIQISFKDNGIGIPSELGNKVFDMFVIGSERSVGAGLGLYEAKVITEEKMDGRIWFKSYGDEKPTEIEVILPLWE